MNVWEKQIKQNSKYTQTCVSRHTRPLRNHELMIPVSGVTTRDPNRVTCLSQAGSPAGCPGCPAAGHADRRGTSGTAAAPGRTGRSDLSAAGGGGSTGPSTGPNTALDSSGLRDRWITKTSWRRVLARRCDPPGRVKLWELEQNLHNSYVLAGDAFLTESRSQRTKLTEFGHPETWRKKQNFSTDRERNVWYNIAGFPT